MVERLYGNEKISLRRELYKDDLWDEYCRLRREVKELKKLNVWREVVEKANTDFDGSRKELWAFVGRRRKREEEEGYSFIEE